MWQTCWEFRAMWQVWQQRPNTNKACNEWTLCDCHEKTENRTHIIYQHCLPFICANAVTFVASYQWIVAFICPELNDGEMLTNRHKRPKEARNFWMNEFEAATVVRHTTHTNTQISIWVKFKMQQWCTFVPFWTRICRSASVNVCVCLYSLALKSSTFGSYYKMPIAGVATETDHV